MYYFDNAATTINKPEKVAQTLYDSIMDSNLGNASRGSHGYALNALEKLYEVRSIINGFLGGDSPSNVVLCPNVTHALNLVIQSLIEPGDHVITTDSEHNSVLRPLYCLEQKGVQLSFLALDEQADVIFDDLEDFVKPSTKALIIQHASNVSGNLNQLHPLAKFCYDRGIYFIVDGAQSVGCIDFTLKSIDYPIIYCFTGHKSLHGPQGTGGMVIKGKYPFKQVFSGGAGMNSFEATQPYMIPELFEYGTLNIHSNIALAEAVKYIKGIGMQEVEQQLRSLSNHFYSEIKKIEGIKLYGNFSGRRVPIVSFNIGEKSSTYISDLLWNKYAIAVRGGFHCAPRYHKSLNTHQQGQIRFSFSGSNHLEEVDYAINAVKELAGN